ncbi:MAG: ArsA family ATPase [Solirubrobacteraceae bacterium]
MNSTVHELLADRRICIIVGAGGVGKTTTSAAVALGMAILGHKVVVVTIDPARRLADALGLEQLGNEPRLVDHSRLRVDVKGELWAMMLDPKRTFDDLIDRFAPSTARAAEIKRNQIYHEVSTAVAGSQEFSAIEKLCELAEDDYDLIVLDTPPARNAADFLSAPGRIITFLEGGPVQMLLRPTGLGVRLLGLGLSPLLSALRAVTGIDLITNLTSFFVLLGGMTEEFQQRAHRVEQLLHATDTGFLLVSSAEQGPSQETIDFNALLARAQMPVIGAIANRIHAHARPGSAQRERAPDLAEKLRLTVEEQSILAHRDAHNLTRLESELGGLPVLTVPELATDIHDLNGLLAICAHIF